MARRALAVALVLVPFGLAVMAIAGVISPWYALGWISGWRARELFSGTGDARNT